jgi:hypothetical protein
MSLAEVVRMKQSAKTAAFRMKIRGQFFDRPAIKRLLGEANHKAMNRAGMDIHRASKDAIGPRSPKVTKGYIKKNHGKFLNVKGGLFHDLTPYGSGKPRPPGKPAKSWGERKNDRWLYKSLKFHYDSSRRSVVVGPDRTPWLARLHEFGGTQAQKLYITGHEAARRAKRQMRKNGFLNKLPNGAPDVGSAMWARANRVRGLRGWEVAGYRTARYPARPFMNSDKVNKKIQKVRTYFKGTIRRG